MIKRCLPPFTIGRICMFRKLLYENLSLDFQFNNLYDGNNCFSVSNEPGNHYSCVFSVGDKLLDGLYSNRFLSGELG